MGCSHLLQLPSNMHSIFRYIFILTSLDFKQTTYSHISRAIFFITTQTGERFFALSACLAFAAFLVTFWQHTSGRPDLHSSPINSTSASDRMASAKSPSTSSSSYLLPLPHEPVLSNLTSQALQDIQDEFALDKHLLDKTVKQMLWEFQKGLSEHASESSKDTFLPMM